MRSIANESAPSEDATMIDLDIFPEKPKTAYRIYTIKNMILITLFSVVKITDAIR